MRGSLAAHPPAHTSKAVQGHVLPSNREERMATRDQDLDTQILTEKLLAAGAEAEQELLRSERKAEKHLADARASLAREEARVRRALERLERSRESAAAAGETLREVQARRAAGPRWGQD